jgi:hypothetical protein
MSNVSTPLWRLAHGRSGDKGNRSNISVIAWEAAFYPLIVEQVNEAAVMRLFAFRHPTAVTRHLLPKLHAMNFVIDDVLDGGVNDSLNLDSHGKSLSFLLLDLRVQVPAQLAARLRGPDASTPSQETSQ